MPETPLLTVYSKLLLQWPGLAALHVGLGAVGQVDPLCGRLEEDALPVLGVDVVDHGSVVAAAELLIVAVGPSVGPPPQNRGPDVVTHLKLLLF